MKQTEEQQAVIALMGEQASRIREIEAEWGIRFSPEDMRPRIEHFHDAVRALSSGVGDPYSKGARLSVEYLAYDMAQLRLIQTKPVGTINRASAPSPSGAPDGAVVLANASAAAKRLPDQKTRQELVALYTQYTVLFAALFAHTAEDGFRVRSEQAEAQTADMGIIEQVLKALITGQMSAQKAQDALMHVERDDVREALQNMLHKGKVSPADMTRAQGMVSTIKQGLAADKKSVGVAHTSFTMAQLAVYEESRDMVKRLASQGLNLAGKFLDAATKNTGQSRGR